MRRNIAILPQMGGAGKLSRSRFRCDDVGASLANTRHTLPQEQAGQHRQPDPARPETCCGQGHSRNCRSRCTQEQKRGPALWRQTKRLPGIHTSPLSSNFSTVAPAATLNLRPVEMPSPPTRAGWPPAPPAPPAGRWMRFRIRSFHAQPTRDEARPPLARASTAQVARGIIPGRILGDLRCGHRCWWGEGDSKPVP